MLRTPNELGPSTRMPLPRARATRRRWQEGAVVTGLGEPGGHDHETAHTLGGAVGDDRLDLDGRHRHDHEVDVPGDVAHRGYDVTPATSSALPVDGVHRPR